MQEIICILDGSGSMAGVANEARNGFNQFLKDQQEIGDANITVIWFDHEWSVEYEGCLKDAKPIGSWKLGGMTALYDAIGKTFNHVKDRFDVEKPEKVIMAIQTDGHENCSKEFTKSIAGDLIKEHEEKYGWEVVFLGAGLSVAEQARDLNIKACNTIVYDSSNTKGGLGQYSSTVASRRTS
jgi:Mg-chelatase subunit ChlD